MIQQLLDLIHSIPFFSSLAFGITAMILVGTSWCLIGYVMGQAPKKQLNVDTVLLAVSAVSILVSAILFVSFGNHFTGTGRELLFCLGCYFGCGLLNNIMLYLMSKAMQRGPNGIIWVCIQSAMIFPFLVGILFYGDIFNVFRGIGIVLLLIALFMFGFLKDNTVQGGKWRLITFSAFLITGCIQTLATAPSFYDFARSIDSALRVLATQTGGFASVILMLLIRREKNFGPAMRETLRRPLLWGYILIMQGFALIFSYMLLYPGLDVMAEHHLGGIAYPLMVASSIIGFSLFSVIQLKERFSVPQLIALTICILGIICCCC